MVAPTVVVYKDAYVIGSGSTRVLTQRTVATGDVVAIDYLSGEFNSLVVGTLAKTAGTAVIGTITKNQEAGTPSHCGNGLFTFTVTTGGTLTLTATASAGNFALPSTFWTYVATGSGGVGNTVSATTTGSQTTVSASLTTSANSYVIAIAGDWSAVGGATTTLIPAGFTLDAHEADGVVDQVANGSQYSSRGGHWASVNAGTATYGVTIPTSSNAAYNLVVCELLGTGAAPASILPQQTKHRFPAAFTRIAGRRGSAVYSR